MPPRGARAQARGASTSRRRRRSPTPSPPPSPPPSPLPWPMPNPNHNERYRMLHKREVVPSKFFDPFAIETLGLQGDINLFINNMGWNQFMGMSALTYKSVTYEISSTLRSTYHPHVEGNPTCIFFRCMGEDRALTMEQFNGIFGFPNTGIAWNVTNFRPTRAWRQLTGQNEYNPSVSKSTHLRNHALRYIHRVMSFSLFGRGKSRGVVNKVELLILWGMANEVPVNTGAWFLRHLLHVAKSPTGNICVGGLLTILAGAFGFQAMEGIHHATPGNNLIDMETLLNMKVCKNMGGGQYRLLDDEGQVIEPPDEQDNEVDEFEEMPHMDEPAPQQEGVNMGDLPQHVPDPPHDLQMAQIMERFDRMEARLTRSEDFQAQMMTLLQQNAAATARIEERLSHLK